MRNGSNGSARGGNTKPLARQGLALKHVFTWHNYPENWLDLMDPKFREFRWICGEEICPTTKTPHLQGFIEYGEKQKFRPIEKFGLPKEISWRPAKGNEYENWTYCSKDGKFHGTIRPKLKLQKLSYDKLLTWQKKIVALFESPEDPLFGRKIHWFWEPTGNFGKSVLTTYFVDHFDCIIVGGGEKDMKHGVATYVESHGHGPELVVLDLARCTRGKFSVKGVEDIKDGCYFSPKFKSNMVRYNRPHVAIFANDAPDEECMSSDRWVIQELEADIPPPLLMLDHKIDALD